MPDQKSYRKRKSRKKASTKRVSVRSELASFNLKGPFPKEMYTRLTYTEKVTLSSTSGNLSTYKWILNGLYDINSTGTGSQPTWFDNLCGASAPYHKYRVLGGEAKFKFVNRNSSSGSIGDVAVLLSNDSITNPTDMDSIINSTNASSATMGVMDGPRGVSYLNKKFSCKRILAKKDLKDDPASAALYNALPTEQVWMQGFYQPIDLVTSADVYLRVEINFIVHLFDRQTPDQS